MPRHSSVCALGKKKGEPEQSDPRERGLSGNSAFSRGGAKWLLLQDLPALFFFFFSETHCLPRPTQRQAPGRNVTSCNVAITAKPVPARGTPRGDGTGGGGLGGMCGLHIRLYWCVCVCVCVCLAGQIPGDLRGSLLGAALGATTLREAASLGRAQSFSCSWRQGPLG
jgi:hypothetical protein